MRGVAAFMVAFSACSSETSTSKDAGGDLGASDDLAGAAVDDLAPADDFAMPPDLKGVCSDDEARCAADACAPLTCLPASNVEGAGVLFRTPGLGAITLHGAADGGVDGAIFDTITGAISGLRAPNSDPTVYAVVDQIGFVRQLQGALSPSPSPSPIAVWVFGGLTVDKGNVVFNGGNAPALLSAGNLTVGANALLDVAARGTLPGAGGFRGGLVYTFGAHDGTNGLGCGGGAGSEVMSGLAGGGGGFGSAGGGNGATDGGQALTCEPYASLTPLVGGSGGGAGSDSAGGTEPWGGASGGALQLFALGTLTVDGRLSAGGGGAKLPIGNSREGSGGGSGGALVLEAPVIVIGAAAGLFANGGGGSSQSAGTGNPACTVAAKDAQLSPSPAPGGSCAPNNTSVGGSGAAGASEATAGMPFGGGGGGFGRVLLRKRSAAEPAIDNAAQLSPPKTHGAFKIVGP